MKCLSYSFLLYFLYKLVREYESVVKLIKSNRMKLQVKRQKKCKCISSKVKTSKQTIINIRLKSIFRAIKCHNIINYVTRT